MPASFTPGPWSVIKNNQTAGELWLSIGHEVPGGAIWGPVIDIVNKRSQYLEAGELRFLAVPEEEQQANARLIAAAPDLLAAVEILLEEAEDPCRCATTGNGHFISQPTRSKVTEAIKAARGLEDA